MTIKQAVLINQSAPNKAQGKKIMKKLRTVRLQPYRRGQGPIFVLNIWSVEGNRIQYQLTMNSLTLFKGSDFHCSALHAIDSDYCVQALMGFLTLRPGDTDSEYFENYSDAQREYCEQHAEALWFEVLNRFNSE